MFAIEVNCLKPIAENKVGAYRIKVTIPKIGILDNTVLDNK